MEVAGNAVGIDLGKRTYEMCIISRTDREDSLKLAKFLRSHEEDEMPVVTPPTDEEWARRKLLSEYRSLKSLRTKEINRLHAIFEHAGT